MSVRPPARPPACLPACLPASVRVTRHCLSVCNLMARFCSVIGYQGILSRLLHDRTPGVRGEAVKAMALVAGVADASAVRWLLLLGEVNKKEKKERGNNARVAIHVSLDGRWFSSLRFKSWVLICRRSRLLQWFFSCRAVLHITITFTIPPWVGGCLELGRLPRVSFSDVGLGLRVGLGTERFLLG